MSVLLDTNVVSELRKPQGRADPRVQEWARAQPTPSLHLSVITILEVEIGVTRMERRDTQQGRQLREWLENRVLVAFEGRILPVDVAVARRAARLHGADPRPERDALIAATALTHDLSVVTRNEQDFIPMGVKVINPWREA